MIQILLAAFVVMLASLVGKVTVWRLFGGFFERHLTYLVSFAAGVLAIIIFHLLEEISQHAGSLQSGIAWVALGAIVVMIAFRYIPDFHHHHDAHETTHSHSKLSANRILLSDGIHNITDGVLIVVAFATSPVLGWLTTLSIFIHEAVQEVSEFFVLRGAGLSVERALFYNFAVSSTVLIGAVGGYFLLEQFEALELPLLGLAAGSYLVVVFNDLIPHSLESSRNSWKHAAAHMAWFLIGLAIMLTVSYVFAHSHELEHAAIAAIAPLV